MTSNMIESHMYRIIMFYLSLNTVKMEIKKKQITNSLNRTVIKCNISF